MRKMDDKITMIKVYDNTRLKIKTQAKRRGMTMIDYIDYLVGKDKRELMKLDRKD